MNELENIRKEIDEIDSEILKLYEKRMQTAGKVAEIKNESMDSIYKEEREKEILDKVRCRVADNKNGAANLFETLMRQSRQLQYKTRVVSKRDSVVDEFINFCSDAERASVCYAGIEGSYSNIACDKMFGDMKKYSNQLFSGVCEDVLNGKADAGVLPIENTTEGIVNEVYDLIVENNLYVINQREIEINHCLAAKSTTKKEDIKTVYSHEQALAQCRKYLLENGFETKAMVNTAVAAQYVCSSEQDNVAAVASKLAAEKYNLNIIDENINTNKNNKTRFIAVAKKPLVLPENDKILIAFTISHESGALAKILNNFGDLGISINCLMSRPLADKPWQYRFYTEFIGNVNDENIRTLLYQLICETTQVKFLGSYK